MPHVFTLAREPRQTVAVPDLRCVDCGRPQLLGLDTGMVACATSWCSACGISVPLWRRLDEAGVDHNPAGDQRLVHHGRPVPWITPVTVDSGDALRPHWRMIHRGRLARAQQRWLCQHCGLAADTAAAVVFVDDAGWCLTSAPLHPACAEVSAAACPRLAMESAIEVVVSSDQVRRHGEVAPEIGLTEDWKLPAALF